MAVYAWGRASNGQLGLGGIEEGSLSTPTLVEKFPRVSGLLKDVVCGWEHTAFLTDDGTVYTCGNNDHGQLGHDKGQTKPERVDSLEVHFIKQMALGSAHTMALTDTGVLFAWGSNEKGQLGLSNSHDKQVSKPRMIKQIFSSLSVAQIACGAEHSLAMTSGGYLFSWGGNLHGQLGIGKVDAGYPVPQFISSLNGIPFCVMCAGGYHSFVLSLSGALFGWGKNSFGQLGISDNKDRSMPTLVKSLRSQHVRHVICGENHTVVLTEDGGVFTFGSGSYGQLGHNSFNHECNPRKVAELMGSTVTQITCGRFHTFAYVQSSGKLYSFGLGASGQLGIGKLNNFNSPMRVTQSWKPGQADGTQKFPALRFTVAGGHHSFVLLTNPEENQAPLDMRIIDRSKCLLTLWESGVRDMVRAVSVTSSFAEVSRNLETVFASQSCLNGSFLDRKTHEKTNSRNHGLELSAVRRCFNILGGIPRESVVNAVCLSVKDRLMPTLRDWNPPDIEALRFLIMLPECEILHKPDYRQSIDIPFGEAILRLSPEARKVLRRWWATLPSTYFSQVMKVFQDCVTYFLKLPIPKGQDDVIFWRQSALFTCLSVLEQLHTVNTEAGDIVPFQRFYIPEIQEVVDIRADLYNWLQDESTFSFCRFPFVFDARAKTQLLQTDAIMQMQSAVEEVNRRNLTSMYSGHFDPVNPLLVIVVRRESIVQDTLTQIMKQGPCNLKKPLKVVFSGEEGIDAGGVAKEFFLLLLTEILDPKYGMFNFIEESLTIWFNDKTFEESPMFLLIGVICGLAIYNSMIIDLHFPPLLYKKLLDRKPTLDDYRAFQPSIARNLQYLLDYPDDDLDSVFGLNFQIARENYGSLEYIDLLPGGGEIPVTVDNRQRYVDLYLDYYLNKSVSKQFEAFAQGFHRVCGGRVLKFFHPEELMQMVVGCQDYDFRDLEKVAEYKGDYYRSHPVITNFWDVFHEFSQQLKKKFLAFLTGNDRIPILGMKSMKIIIQPVAGGESGDHLPVAHTCFNLLDLPRYPTKELMKTKLSQAVQYSTGFGLA